MIDDLVSRGVSEPYRMFTSRAEYRLSLRADNADQRLTPLGIALGAVGSERRRVFEQKKAALDAARSALAKRTVTPSEATRKGVRMNQDGVRRSVFDVLAQVEGGWPAVLALWPELASIDAKTAAQIEVEARYATYLDRQEADIESFRRDEAIVLPAELDFESIVGLSNELREKLTRARPATLAQAARIEGMTPAALTLLLIRARPARGRHAV
jgi:tRNA uridine 5-carboxymethylaminomethyl modification enzyme